MSASWMSIAGTCPLIHFITFSCHARDPLLSDPHARDIFEQTLERVRTWYGFFVSGCGAPPGNMNARRRSQDYNSLRLSGPDIPTSEGELMRLTKMLVVLLVIALSVSLALPAFAQDGAATYKAKCAGCHG